MLLVLTEARVQLQVHSYIHCYCFAVELDVR